MAWPARRHEAHHGHDHAPGIDPREPHTHQHRHVRLVHRPRTIPTSIIVLSTVEDEAARHDAKVADVSARLAEVQAPVLLPQMWVAYRTTTCLFPEAGERIHVNGVWKTVWSGQDNARIPDFTGERATLLRIDTIEQVLRTSGVLKCDVGPSGYVVAYALARANLRLGKNVVADCVNPLPVTRAAWREVAVTASSPIVEIEIVCSDVAEHRHRVETRKIDVPGLARPTWDSVLQHDYEPWAGSRLVLDTAGRSIADAAAVLRSRISVVSST
ncbi:MAG: AAA family ATPase [Janthinobacterium lividum]